MIWTKTSDKLPPKVNDKFDDSDYVLGFEYGNQHPVVCWYNHADKHWIVSHYKADSFSIDISHWMPLPKPPQE